MTLIANTVGAAWAAVMTDLAGLLHIRQAHPSRTVVLLPYAQLIGQAKLAWVGHSGVTSLFMPRFETTMNWAGALPGLVSSPEDIRMDAAVDALTASALLTRAGLSAQQTDLSGALVESAWALARVAAAQHPNNRLAWGAALALDISASMQSPALAYELAVARIALAWAAASSYPTDVLFSVELDLIVVIEGFQSEPLTKALIAHFGQRAASLQLITPEGQGAVALHTAADLEGEAHLAAACVLAHLAQGRSPVALVAQDRVLSRRVRAILSDKGAVLRDETGWKLSTTRAAATLVGLLRAMHWDASTDTVLDWLKNATAFDARAVALAEVGLRKLGIRGWRGVPTDATFDPPELPVLAAQVAKHRDAFGRSRSLADWLRDLRSALQSAGQWTALAGDAAGMAVIAALHMDDDSFWTFSAHTNPRMSLQDFTHWAQDALEAASFTPPHPLDAQVVMLPLAQLLGRQLAAVVLPGCDELRLPVSPEPPGAWTPQQRILLGLPTREELRQAQRAAWQYALTAPHLDVLWRTSEGGESLMPSGFVQELVLTQKLTLAIDMRPQRLLAAQPTPHPAPTGQALPVTKLSASAYEDLRRCPYRFFALRQLKLQEADELESELGKRDFGNWLHLLLNTFHEALKNTPNRPLSQDNQGLAAMLNIAADEATKTLD